jgi:hypothetical protein
LKTPGIVDGSTRNLFNDLLPLQRVVAWSGMCRGGTGSRVLAVSIVGLVENFSGGGAGF